ncbi:MAG: hypothetical protein HY518_01160 [Candidatus Aenigmarchaeota archaeon]|nr:hypothetical protein [Candidatus Aenigmarchaeota archaeon]
MAFGIIGAIVGILLVLMGIFLVIFFPMATAHQQEKFSWMGIIMGIIFLVVGGLLIFN